MGESERRIGKKIDVKKWRDEKRARLARKASKACGLWKKDPEGVKPLGSRVVKCQ